MKSTQRSISLIEKTDAKYLGHCKEMAFSRNINRHLTVPDSKRIITGWLEQALIRFLSSFYALHQKNILTWEELTKFNTYARRYRELDAVFKLESVTIYFEIKASQSNSSYKRGITQINHNLSLLQRIDSDTRAVLVLADCRSFDMSFGYHKDKISESIGKSTVYVLKEGLKDPIELNSSAKTLWMLNADDICELASKYGAPLEEDSFSEY